MTPEQEISRVKSLVSAAKALLSLQVGLAVGAIRIQNALSKLGSVIENKHTIFSEFIGAIPAEIPLGSARLLWNLEVILDQDSKLAKIEVKYREALLHECVEIINFYGRPFH